MVETKPGQVTGSTPDNNIRGQASSPRAGFVLALAIWAGIIC
ncbi:MAG: hypothetical protein ABSB91_05605 [Sedimentisphaerales bacterium]